MPKVSVIIVHYKTLELTFQCIKSILQFEASQIEVIVVDNDSQDGIEEKLAAEMPTIRFHQMGYNSGFARANNAGIKLSTGDLILLLNGDTIVKDNAINVSAAALSSSSYVACGVQLLNADGSAQISGSHTMKGGLNYLLPLPYLGRFLKKLAGLFKVKKTSIDFVKVIMEVDWINGAYLMVKKSVIQKAGMLDEEFFLYAEEAEWCHRIKKYGKLCIYGGVNVIHLQGVSAAAAFDSPVAGYANLFDKKGLQIMVSNFLWVRKQWGVFWVLVLFGGYIFTIPIMALGIALQKLFSSKSAFTFQQWSGFTRNIGKLTTLLPDMILKKKRFYKML